jgi:hypothetical protein
MRRYFDIMSFAETPRMHRLQAGTTSLFQTAHAVGQRLLLPQTLSILRATRRLRRKREIIQPEIFTLPDALIMPRTQATPIANGRTPHAVYLNPANPWLLYGLESVDGFRSQGRQTISLQCVVLG